MKIESLNRRICPQGATQGENRRWAFFCNWDIIHPSAFILHPCSSAGLVIEVDCDVHDLQKEEDERREKVLTEMGLKIVRFRNDEVVRNVSTVVGKIREMISVSI